MKFLDNYQNKPMHFCELSLDFYLSGMAHRNFLTLPLRLPLWLP